MTSQMVATCDPDILIEEQRPGYVRYRHSNGWRWEVHGVCDRRAHCVVGMLIGGKLVETLDEAKALADAYAGPDCPVLPGFKGCCPLEIVELTPQGG